MSTRRPSGRAGSAPRGRAGSGPARGGPSNGCLVLALVIGGICAMQLGLAIGLVLAFAT